MQRGIAGLVSGLAVVALGAVIARRNDAAAPGVRSKTSLSRGTRGSALGCVIRWRVRWLASRASSTLIGKVELVR